jgi:tetratricopeptide (TPR) repeat protein
MAGNKAIYDTAMKRAHEYAWANQWDRAIREYKRAITEFPGDRTAQRNMAQCLFRLRQWPQAETAYQDLINSDPTDLFALNRLAEIYLALGQQDNALSTYNQLADQYVATSQFHEAIRALRDLSRAMPNSKEVHARLLGLTMEVADKQAQLAEHMALSRIALDEGNLPEAQKHADAATTLDPDGPEVRKWVYTVRRKVAEHASTHTLPGDSDATGYMTTSMGGTNLMSVVEQDPAEAAALVEQANEAQNAGDFRLALDLYDQAVRAGARKASVFYSAGLLNQQMGRAQIAIPYLERAAQDGEFATSSNYVMGQCYVALRNYPKAITALERALSLIDFSQLSRNEADELIELYTAAAEANLADNNIGRAASLFANLVNIFKERRWTHPELADLENKADELYNKSIQSKLLGISKGSGQLDPGALVSATKSDATSFMTEKPTEDATSRLAGGTSVIVEDSQAEPAPAARSETATAMMRQPGSNLRTITEFLRTADAMNTGDTISDVLGGPSVPLHPEATEVISRPLNGTPTELPAASLADVEQQTLTVQRMIAEGEFAMGQGMWDAAIDACMGVIGTEPTYLPIHLMLADIYMQQSKMDEAVDKLQMVMETYVARQEPENAVPVCRRLLDLQPDNPALETRLGLLLLDAGRVDEAARSLLAIPEKYHKAGESQRALEEALNLKAKLPNSSEVALAIGTFLKSLGHNKDALVELSRALHLDPGNNLALVRLYTLLASNNDTTQWDALQSVLERAAKEKSLTRVYLEELHSAIKHKPTPPLYYGLSVMAERGGLPDIASDALDQGLTQIAMAETAELHNSWLLVEVLMCQARGDLALNAKDGAMAAQHYGRALDAIKSYSESEGEAVLQSPRPQYGFLRVPEPTELYYGLAEAHASENNWDGALLALQALKGLMPNDHSVYTRIADIYFRQGQLNQALDELNDLLIIYQKGGDHEKTLETLSNMARLAPNNVAVRRKLGDMYIKLGMTEYGLKEMSTLAELQLKAGLLKDAMATYQKAADLHYTMGQHDKAIEIYERIVRIAPRDIEARHQLINMYIQSGKIEDAIASERSLAEFYVREGQAEGAIAALHQLLALSPEDVPAHHMLAKQLTSLEKYGEAARLYGRLVRLEPDNDRVSILHTEMLRMAKEAGQKTKPALARK